MPSLRRSIVLGLLLASGSFAAAASRQRFLITDGGAVGDGSTVNTQSIQASIDRCSGAGGGVLVVPRGVFLSGALYFKPGVDLLVEKDGVLKSTTNRADFPPLYTRWEGVERYWTAAFLNFIGLEQVTVSGEGLIDGSGDAWSGFGKQPRGTRPRGAPAAPLGPLPDPAKIYPTPRPTTAVLNFAPQADHLPAVNAAGIRLPGGGFRLSPPRALVFQNCADVRVSGLHLKNEARWGFVFIYCHDVVAEDLTIHAEHYIPSSDGMDVDSCRRVLITGCDIECNDDCISIKSGKDEDGRRVNLPCEDVIIEKTRFAYGQGGAAMGSETSGGIRRVEVRNCRSDNGNWAPIRIKSQPSRGGVIEDITYRDIELNGVLRAFEFDLAWNMRINDPAAVHLPPTLRNIKLIDIHGTAQSAGIIRGLPDSLIRNVSFTRCAVTVQHPLEIENARDIDQSGLKVTVAP